MCLLGLIMSEKKQVDKTHYQFDRYMTKARWNSVWHQLDEVLQLKPETVLEIGPGSGVFKGVAALYGLKIETLDLDPELNPDYVGSATALPFSDNSYDVVCAFQILEHLPYEKSLHAFSEMARVSRHYVVISLPDARNAWRYMIHIPKYGSFDFFIPFFKLKAYTDFNNYEHHWEINKIGYSLKKVVNDFSKYMDLIKSYRVKENLYHRFLVFKNMQDF